MKKYFKYLLLFLTVITVGERANAGDKDSARLLRMQDYVLKSIERQVKDNEARAKKGLPQNYIVVADMRKAEQYAKYGNNDYVKWLRQAHTTEETINSIWDFNNNPYLKGLSAQLDSFASTYGVHYYMVIAAIYNVDDDEKEATDFSNVSWKDVESLKDTNGLSLRTVAGALSADESNYYKFTKLVGMLQQKLKAEPNTLYHFVVTSYFPRANNTTGRLSGAVAHIQSLTNIQVSDRGVYNDALANFAKRSSILVSQKDKSTKEGWLWAGVSLNLDAIALIRNFKESDLMAINNQDSMIQYLKVLPRPELLLYGMSFITREHVIKVLNSGLLRDDYTLPLFGSGGENAMLVVFKTTPPEQVDSLQDLLSANSYALLKDLDYKFDDLNKDDDGNQNYTAFVQTLTKLLSDGVTKDKLAELFRLGRVYKLAAVSGEKQLMNPYDDDIMEQFNKHMADSGNINGSFTRKFTSVAASNDDLTQYILVKQVETWSYKTLQEQYLKPVQDATVTTNTSNLIDEIAADNVVKENSTILGPFDMVLVYPETDFTTNGFTLKKEAFQYIPLYYYYWLRKKKIIEDFKKMKANAEKVVEFIGLFAGVTEVAEGVVWTEELMKAAGWLNDARETLNDITDGGADAWIKEKMGDEAYTLLKFVDYSKSIYDKTQGGIELVQKVGTTARAVKVNLRRVFSKNTSLLTKLKRSTKGFKALLNYYEEEYDGDKEALEGLLEIFSEEGELGGLYALSQDPKSESGSGVTLADNGTLFKADWDTLFAQNAELLQIRRDLYSGARARKLVTYLNWDEEAVVTYFTSDDGHAALNTALNSGQPLTKFFAIYEAALNQALNKIQAYTQPDMFFLGLKRTDMEKVKQAYKVDSIMSAYQFLPCIYNPNDFITTSQQKGYNVIIRIEGKNGRLVEGAAQSSKEMQVLFKSHTQFVVVKAGYEPHPDSSYNNEQTGHNIWTVVIREL